jgi:lipopolysaccharide heptosyltransferase II
VIFTVCTQSALPAATLLFEAAIPLRAAYARENPYALLTDWRAEPDRELAYGMRHEVERQIDLVASLGIAVHDRALQFPVSAAARRAMLRHARACGLDTRRRWLVVHPGATASSRRYPVHRFSEAVRLLAAKDRWQIAIAGDEADKATARALATNAEGVVDLAGRLDLAELAALLEAADAVVCNNSSPAHLAAAVGTPVVDLYALTNPQHTPWGVAHRVLSRDVECRWCLKSVCPHGHPRCLADVAPSAIVASGETAPVSADFIHGARKTMTSSTNGNARATVAPAGDTSNVNERPARASLSARSAGVVIRRSPMPSSRTASIERASLHAGFDFISS